MYTPLAEGGYGVMTFPGIVIINQRKNINSTHRTCQLPFAPERTFGISTIRFVDSTWTYFGDHRINTPDQFHTPP